MKIGIGIMAHNEAAHIRGTIESLAGQDLLNPPDGRAVTVEIVCAANGCTDDTAAVTAAAMQELLSGKPGVTARVEVIAKAGKSHAWNEYVHRLAAPDADCLFLLDADIRFVGAATLRHLVEALESAPEAHVAVDTILKDIALKEHRTAREKMSLAASDLSTAGPPKIAGSLYCGRGDVLRAIWMPVGLLVEDGFLKAMVTTDRFTQPENPQRIVRAADAAHVFEAVTDVRTLFRHEVRLLVGSAMNFIVFDFLAERVRRDGSDAGTCIQRLNAEDPGWFAALIDARLRNRGFWVAPTGFIALPLRQWRRLPLRRALPRLPTALLRAAFNLAAACAANRQLKRRQFRW